MAGLSSVEAEAIERARAAPMLEAVTAWAEINSGSRNLLGLGRVRALIADDFSRLPGNLELRDPTPVESVDAAGGPVHV